MSKVDPYLFMYKVVVFEVNVYYYLFWARSKFNIDNTMKSLKEDLSSYIGNTQMESLCLSS